MKTLKVVQNVIINMDTSGSRHYGPAPTGGLILYCTALFCTVLYKKRRMKEEKIRKFADTQRTIRQSDNQTFQRLRPLSSSDYSRELANKFYSILFHSMTVTSSQISPMTLAMSVYLPSRPLTSLLRGCCSHNRE